MNYLPTNHYAVIYCDPPWSYRNGATRAAAAKHYRTMPLRYLRALPVQDLGAADCYLFMWATPPMILEALSLMGAWGFEYKTTAFSWVKQNKDGSIFKGLGNYTRSNMEMCLLGRRGKILERIDKSVSSVVLSPRLRHSQKPQEVADRIVQMYGDLPRIELFARDRKPGWDAWGDELADVLAAPVVA